MLSPRGQSGIEVKILASKVSKLWPRPRPVGLGLKHVASVTDYGTSHNAEGKRTDDRR